MDGHLINKATSQGKRNKKRDFFLIDDIHTNCMQIQSCSICIFLNIHLLWRKQWQRGGWISQLTLRSKRGRERQSNKQNEEKNRHSGRGGGGDWGVVGIWQKKEGWLEAEGKKDRWGNECASHRQIHGINISSLGTGNAQDTSRWLSVKWQTPSGNHL